MEHPSKRQRLSRVAGRPSSVGLGTRGNDDGILISAEAENDDDEAPKEVTQAEASPPNHPLNLRTLSVPPNTLTWSSERRRAVEGRHRRLHRRRDDSPNEQKHPAMTVPLLVKTLTIVDTVGISGTDPGVIVFPTTLTVSSSQISGSTPGPTLPTISSSPPLTGSTAPSYPFIIASATESAGSSGNYTSPTGSTDSSKPTSGISPTTMLGSSPQIVLSSPPSTPLSPSPSGSSSGQSFFEQTPSNTTTASLATLSGTSFSNSQTTPAPDLPYLIRPVNGSTSTIVLSNNSTTFTATSIITVNSLTSNSSISSASTDNTSSSSTLQSSSFSSNTTTTSASSVTSSTTSFSSTSTTASTSSASTSGGIGAGAGGAGAATGSGAAPTGGSGSGNSSGGSSGPSTPAVVGGVVGGLAGLALLLVLILMFLRWRKRKQKAQQQAAVAGPESAPPPSRAGEAAPSEDMTQRSSVTPLAAAGFLKRFRPTSQQTATTTETTPSERGFVNLGGRKLPSVFGPAGGDGFGGGYNREALSGSSFYRDSQGFYGGPGGAGPSTSPATPGPSRQPGQRPESDVAVLRPSPARTPVTSQGPAAPLPAPPRGPSTPRRQNSPDGIGRSHPSFDGSRGSRFQEEDV